MNQTISADYLEQQRKLHENPNYGVASLSFAPIVVDVMRHTGCKSVSNDGAVPESSRNCYPHTSHFWLEEFPPYPHARFAKWAPPSTAATSFAQTNWKMVRRSPIFGYDGDLADSSTKCNFD